MKNRLARGKVFYGWYIVASGFVLMGTTMSISINCQTLFINPVCSDLGYSRSQIALVATIIAACAMMISFLSQRLFLLFGIRRLMQAACLLITGGFLCYSFATELWTFYLAAFFVGVSYALLTSISFSVILTNWFEDRLGFAIGLAFMGTAVGGMIFTALTGYWIELFGWRSAYRMLAGVLCVITIPIVYLFIYPKPEDLGLEPLRRRDESGVPVVPPAGVGSLKEARKTLRFWLMAFSIALMSYAMSTLAFTIAPHLNNAGYSGTFSANIASVSMGVLIGGKLLLGYAFDRLGTPVATLISCILVWVGLLGMVMAGSVVSIAMIILGVGLGSAFGTVGYQLLVQSSLSEYSFPSIYGFLLACSNLGGLIAPFNNGLIYDATGSYRTAMMLASFMVLLAGGIFQVVLRWKNVSAK